MISQKELQRQFRVLDQMLSMHNALLDRFSALSLLLDVSLLACALVFCATTFVSDDLFISLGLTPNKMRILLGSVSILAFFASIISLRVNWKGKQSRHKEAAQQIAVTLARYRELRSEAGTWPSQMSGELNQMYWGVMNNTTKIPHRNFAALKAKHLRKVALSKLLDTHPGCPLFLLRLILFRSSLRGLSSRKKEYQYEKKTKL